MNLKYEKAFSICHNAWLHVENFVKEAIDSILNQSYPNFEFIIIINDGSADNTSSIIKLEEDPRIIYIDNGSTEGIIFAGMKVADWLKVNIFV